MKQVCNLPVLRGRVSHEWKLLMPENKASYQAPMREPQFKQQIFGSFRFSPVKKK